MPPRARRSTRSSPPPPTTSILLPPPPPTSRTSIIIKSREDLNRIPKINGVYHLVSANLKEADLVFVDLNGAILNKANLTKARLIGAKLEGSQLEKANLMLAELGGANLQNANLNKADLRSAKLENANLEGANLKGANLEGANLHTANLQGADLRGADLEDANLRRAILQGADLRGAKNIPEHAKLEGAILTDEDYENRNINNSWIPDEKCSSEKDPISLEEIPANRGFRLKADENPTNPDSLNNCFDVASLAEMMKLNRPLISPLTRADFTDVDKERIRNYIQLHPSGGRQNRKSNKQRKTTKTTRKMRK